MREVETTLESLSSTNAATAPLRVAALVVDARGRCALEEAVVFVLSDCFLAGGQSIGTRTTEDHAATVLAPRSLPDEIPGGDA